jgi:hypothetical protein
VIQNRDLQQLPRLQELPGESKIFRAGIQAAGGVVVGHQDAAGPLPNGAAEGFPRVGEGFRGGSPGYDLLADEALLDVQVQDGKMLLGLPHQVAA